MCLLLCAYKSHPRYPLVIGANRDEYHDRPAAEAGFWEGSPSILAGRDLRAGGTWLGISRQGRFAAVTNFIEKAKGTEPPHSRGALVPGFLRSDLLPEEFAEYILHSGHNYQGFTLVFGTVEGLYCCSNRADRCVPLSPGFHGLGNRLLNDNSLKVRRGKKALRALMSGPDILRPEDLFSLLNDRTAGPCAAETTRANEGEGPDCSSFLISGKEFGTRCSTGIIIDNSGKVCFAERTFTPDGTPAKTVEFVFHIDQPPL